MKFTNPFFALLVVVGLAFAISACAYTVMSFQNLDPHVIDRPGLPQLMKEHGMLILGVELGLLTLLTISAITTDDYWVKRAERK